MVKKKLLADNYETFRDLEKQLRSVPLLAQGTVMCIPPSPNAPRANNRYMWTRKVKGRTVTKSLTEKQYEHLLKAIEANRKIERTLTALRDLSQDCILNNLPSPPKRSSKKTS